MVDRESSRQGREARAVKDRNEVIQKRKIKNGQTLLYVENISQSLEKHKHIPNCKVKTVDAGTGLVVIEIPQNVSETTSEKTVLKVVSPYALFPDEKEGL